MWVSNLVMISLSTIITSARSSLCYTLGPSSVSQFLLQITQDRSHNACNSQDRQTNSTIKQKKHLKFSQNKDESKHIMIMMKPASGHWPRSSKSGPAIQETHCSHTACHVSLQIRWKLHSTIIFKYFCPRNDHNQDFGKVDKVDLAT